MDNNKQQYRAEAGFLPFDPIVLVLDVAKRWLLILLAALTVGVGTYVITDMSYTPSYSTTITYVVTNQSSSSTVYSNLSSTSNLATVFSGLLNSSVLRKAILEEIDEEVFYGTIKSSVIGETNLLTVTVTDSNPRTCYLVARAIMEHHHLVTGRVIEGITLEVLQEPKVPTAPGNRADASGQMKKAALLAGAAMTVLLAFLSYSRDVVRSSAEVKAKLDCDLLGEIPHEQKYKTIPARIRRKKTSILITNPVTGFRFVESIRKLRRRVEQRMHDDKVLLVSSFLENEGKSTVAVNLALALAKKHGRVLLIDCDLHKPACHVLLGQKTVDHGLREVLNGSVPVADGLIREKSSKLYLLLEQQGDAHCGDLLASDNMRALLNWARQEFDYVVLDLPPMSAVSDVESLKELADASILVVRQNAASTAALNNALASLDSGKARLLGCVLNNVYSTRWSSGQNYGYGYSYGYGKYGRYGYYGHYGRYGSYGSASSNQKGR